MFVRSARLGYPRWEPNDRTRLRLKRGYLSTPQKGAAALAGPLEIKIVEIFYVSFVALPQRLKAYLGAPRFDRKRVRSSAPLVALRGAPKGRVGHSEQTKFVECPLEAPEIPEGF